MKDLEKITGEVHPRCTTCGYQDKFEHNDDFTYIKCTNCGREYFGGKDELLEYNEEAIEEAKDELAKRVTPMIQNELMNMFKKFK